MDKNFEINYHWRDSKKSFNEFILRLTEGIVDEIKQKYDIPDRWRSEAELYNAIKTIYNKQTVVRGGRPKWLGRQHLDIYFPKLNIGIEYQVKQHFEAVEFFGGEEGLKDTQERDKRKKKLCDENRCQLIYVLPDYDIEDLIKSIDNAIAKN